MGAMMVKMMELKKGKKSANTSGRDRNCFGMFLYTITSLIQCSYCISQYRTMLTLYYNTPTAL